MVIAPLFPFCGNARVVGYGVGSVKRFRTLKVVRGGATGDRIKRVKQYGR